MKLLATCSAKNANILKLGSIGVVLLLLATLVIVSDPLQMIIDSQLTMRTGSLLFNLWRKPPLEVFIAVYIFNVTNLDAFMNGSAAKLKVAEVGPYVYQEVLENFNVTFNENNTVTYNPRRTVKYIRERSVGDPKVDRIIAPNIPYMGVSSIASDFSIFAAIGMRALTKRLNAKTMMEMTVHEYLWGYEDNLVQLAAKIVPSIINFKSFGLLDRMFDEGDNVVTMKLPEPKKHSKAAKVKKTEAGDFSIDNWNGEKGIKLWGYNEKENKTQCSPLRGAYEGTLFPHYIGTGETFRVYRKAFCRALPISYTHTTVINGIEGYSFKLHDDAFDSDMNDPTSSCFCKSNKCMKKGLGNITPCYYNFPLAVSFPHFFNADPSLLKGVDGLEPNEEKHGSQVVIQPQVGVPMKVSTRFQLNLLMGDVKFNADMSRFRNTVLPIFWFDTGIEQLPPGLAVLLKLLFNICPYVQLGLVAALVIAGVALLGIALLQCFCTQTPWHALGEVSAEPRGSIIPNVCLLPLLKQQQTKVSEFGKCKLQCTKSKLQRDVALLPLQSEAETELDFEV